jgi:TPP-dependent pyruvate/acetoin dehydrogenase alpha subunit
VKRRGREAPREERRSPISVHQDPSVVGQTELFLDLYRSMALIRGFEDLIQSLFLRGEIYGTTHLYSGQEAVAVGVASVLEDRDRLAATYRGHGHALALGVDPQGILDEMLGRATGINGGRAGSMNINSPRDRLVGSFGIVGGTIAAATGVALALKRVGGVAVCQFGDGAINQGYFYECLNFCAVLRLPVVFLCENNGYGEYTAFQDVTAGAIRARADAMEVPAEQVDGMSVVAVREAAARAVAHARSGEGPYFIEAVTYRYVGHSRSDPGAYRPPGELEAWKERDPIPRLRGELVDAGVDASTLDAIDEELATTLEAMTRKGLEAPFPEPRSTSEFSG